MSTNMVRKQIYIRKRQEVLLKRLAQARGLSEAEVIRQAIQRELGGATTQPDTGPTGAMDDFARLALSKRSDGAQGEPYRWNREEIYAEREGRWFRDRSRDRSREREKE